MKSYDVVKIDEVEEIDSCYSIVEMEPSEEGDMIRLVENFENYLCAKFVLRALMEADVNFKYYKIVKTSEIKAGKHFEKSE